MKKVCLITMSLSLLAFQLLAQSIDVKEDKEKISGSYKNVLSVMIYEADESSILKSWKRLMKDADAKVKNSGNEVFADDAKLNDISNNTVDVYASVKNEDKGFRFSAAFDLGGSFLSESQHSSGFKIAKKMIYNFAIETTKEAFEQKIKRKESDIRNLESKHSNLERDHEHLVRDIENYKEKIDKAEKEKVENLKSRQELKKTIEQSKIELEAIQESATKVK